MMLKLFKIEILAIVFLLLLGLNPARADNSQFVEKGEIYIESSADTDDAAVKIPTTLPHSILTITPKVDPDAAGTSVVGTWDFILKDAATGSTDSKYWRFSEILMPMQLVGYQTIYPNGAYICSTPTTSTSGAARSVGQWFEWFTEILR